MILNEAPEFRIDTLTELLSQVDRGEASFAQALQLHPVVIGMLVEKAIAMMDAGQLDEAEQLFVDLSNVDNLEPMLPFLLGACRAEKNDFEQAVDAYSEALLRLERPDATLAQRILLCRAWALLELGRAEEAKDGLHLVAAGEDAALAQQAVTLLQQLSLGGQVSSAVDEVG